VFTGAVVLVVLVLAAVIIVLKATRHDERDAGRGAATPVPSSLAPHPSLPSDSNRIRAAHSGLCLTERPDADDGHVYQGPCASAIPRMKPVQVTEGVYRVQTTHPRFGDGCMGVENAAATVGAAVGDDFCTEPDAKDMRIEPVTTPSPGFRIRVVQTGLCLGVQRASQEAWQPLLQLTCDPANLGQVFIFYSA
jgi:hypothetical protein